MQNKSLSADSWISSRLATQEDEDFLFQLFCEVRADTFAMLPLADAQRDILLRMQFDAQRKSYRAQYPEANVEIILFDGEPVGQWILAKHHDHNCLVDISVLESSRQQGIGTWAANTAIMSSRERNLPLRAQVARDNPRAKALWLRSGLKIVDEDETYTALEFTP